MVGGHRPQARQVQGLLADHVVGPVVDAAGPRHGEVDARTRHQLHLAGGKAVAQLDELAGGVLHRVGARHAGAVVQPHVFAQAHAAAAAAHVLLVHLGFQAVGGDVALAGEAERGQQPGAHLHRRVVARALALPQHAGIAVQLAAVVAAQLVGEARVGGPAGQEGRCRGAGGRGGRGRRRCSGGGDVGCRVGIVGHGVGRCRRGGRFGQQGGRGGAGRRIGRLRHGFRRVLGRRRRQFRVGSGRGAGRGLGPGWAWLLCFSFSSCWRRPDKR